MYSYSFVPFFGVLRTRPVGEIISYSIYNTKYNYVSLWLLTNLPTINANITVRYNCPDMQKMIEENWERGAVGTMSPYPKEVSVTKL